jgi:hypothetical protein
LKKDSTIQQLEQKLEKLTPKEQDMLLKYFKNAPNTINNKHYSIGKNSIRILIAGDRHMGNINYDSALHQLSVDVAKKEKAEMILDPGDIFDGWYQCRAHSIFEQNAIGLDQQMKVAVSELKKYGTIPFHYITGNHEYQTFMRGAGIEVGEYLQEKLGKVGMDAHFLGNGEGDLVMKGGATIKLLHPDGGTAYAISYKSQKIAESLEGGKKPGLMIIGNFHKAEYIFYRNIHILQSGTLEGQTKYMRGKPTPAHKGFWLVDIHSNNNAGIDCIVPRFYPAYD